MTSRPSGAAKNVSSGREVVPDDVEILWFDLMAGRSTARQIAKRARLLMETVNATHLANWGLSTSYALTSSGTPGQDRIRLAHERWHGASRSTRLILPDGTATTTSG